MHPFDDFPSLYITPACRWLAMDALIAKFHLSRSALLTMIGAFIGLNFMRESYALAIRERYCFDSFDDAMLIR